MTASYHREQHTQLKNEFPLLQQSEMPSFYQSTRHRTLITKQLSTNEDDDDDDPNSIYKEAFIIEIFQHWKTKALEHQHTINNTGSIPSSNTLLQKSSSAISSIEQSNSQKPSGEPSSNNNINDSININESTELTREVQKRLKPSPILSKREKTLKKCFRIPNETSNPSLLVPHSKTKYATSTNVARKPSRPTLVFIEPKKTQPSFPLRSYATFSFDESTSTKHRSLLENQDSNEDDQYSPSSISPRSTNSCTSQVRSFFPLTNNSFYDDETSSDEGYQESLLIRDRKNIIKPKQSQDKPTYYATSNLATPTAIYITDPHGYSRNFDWNNGFLGEPFRFEYDSEKKLDSTNRNHSSSSGSFSASSLHNTTDHILTESSVPDKYPLHIIGEEEEEIMDKRVCVKDIVPKSKNHVETYGTTQTSKSTVSTMDTSQNQYENEKNAFGRRWSDSLISDEDEQKQSLQRSITKAPSSTFIMKTPVTQPTKISKTKYILMKLHLTSSSQKYEDSNTSAKTANSLASSPIPPPPPPSQRKRTVRRALDKKRYQTQ